MRRTQSILAAGATALAACLLSATALAQPPAAKASAPPKIGGLGGCFRTTDIDNSLQVSRTQLNLRTRDNRYFRVDMAGSCLDPLGIDPIVLVTRGPDMICRPIDMDISGTQGGFKSPCIVKSITPLTAADVAALPRKQKP